MIRIKGNILENRHRCLFEQWKYRQTIGCQCKMDQLLLFLLAQMNYTCLEDMGCELLPWVSGLCRIPFLSSKEGNVAYILKALIQSQIYILSLSLSFFFLSALSKCLTYTVITEVYTSLFASSAVKYHLDEGWGRQLQKLLQIDLLYSMFHMLHLALWSGMH